MYKIKVNNVLLDRVFDDMEGIIAYLTENLISIEDIKIERIDPEKRGIL